MPGIRRLRAPAINRKQALQTHAAGGGPRAHTAKEAAKEEGGRGRPCLHAVQKEVDCRGDGVGDGGVLAARGDELPHRDGEGQHDERGKDRHPAGGEQRQRAGGRWVGTGQLCGQHVTAQGLADGPEGGAAAVWLLLAQRQVCTEAERSKRGTAAQAPGFVQQQQGQHPPGGDGVGVEGERDPSIPHDCKHREPRHGK